MSTPQEFMDRLFAQATAPQNPQQVAARNAGISEASGYGQSSTPLNGVEADVRTMDATQLSQKYGYDRAMQLLASQAAGASQYNRLSQAGGRSALGAVDDTVQGIADGVVNSVGGITGLAASVVPGGGNAVSELLNDYNNWSQSKRSTQTQGRRAAEQLRTPLRERDNAQALADDKAADGPNSSGIRTQLRRLGREALSGGGAMFDDGTLFADSLGQAVGSLATAGPVGRGLSAAGRGVGAVGRANAPNLASKVDEVVHNFRGGAAPTAFQQTVNRRMDKMAELAPTMAAITAMESGGTYTSTMQDVQQMTHSQLLETSPVYAELLNQGMSIEDAKLEVANAAGLQAAGQMAMLAAPLSALVARFEGNIFARGTFRNLGSNAVGEAVEEGGVGLGGAMMQNAAIADYADRNRDLMQGAGEGLAQGLILGPAAAGVTATPGAIIQSALDGAQYGLGKAQDFLQKKQEEGQAAREAVQRAPIMDRHKTVMAAAQEAAPDLEVETPEAQTEWANVSKNYDFNPEEFAPEYVGPAVAQAVAGSANMPEALSRLVSAYGSISDPTQKAIAGEVAFHLVQAMHGAVGEAKANASKASSPRVTAALNEMRSSILTAVQDKALGEVINEFAARAAQQQANVTPETDPQEAVQTVNNVVATDPAALSPEAGRIALQHAQNGTAQMSDAQLAALTAALEMVESDAQIQAELEASGIERTKQDRVSKMVRTSSEWGEGTAQAISGHVARLSNFISQGNLEDAGKQADHLLNFATNMANKVDAINAAYEAGGGPNVRVGYDQYTTDGRWRRTKSDSKEGLGITPQSENSVAFAQMVEADARRVANTVNAMADAYPQLGLPKVKLPALVPALKGNVEQVAANHRGSRQAAGPAMVRRGNAPAAQTAAPAPVPSPAPAKQEAPAPKAEPKVEEAPTIDVAPVNDAEAPAIVLPPSKEEARQEGPVQLPVTGRFTAKDQKKADKANKFIGRGSDRSSTQKYADAWAEQAGPENVNSESYTADDVVFVSVEGARSGRKPLDKAQVKKATDAGATIVADGQAARSTNYNVGEQELATFLGEQNYEEVSDGTWKPRAEEVQQAPVEETAPAPADVVQAEGRFQNLQPKSWFNRVFRPNKDTTLFQDAGAPVMETLQSIFASGDLNLLAGKLKNLSDAAIEAYAGYFEDGANVVAELDNRLQTFLDQKVSKDSDRTRREQLLEDELLMHTDNGRVLHLVDATEDGELHYNPELVTGGVMAGLQWLIASGNGGLELNRSEWQDALTTPVSADAVPALNEGTGYDAAVDDVASRIARYWNVSAIPDSLIGMTQGIPSGLAQEVLEVLNTMGIIEIKTVHLDLEGKLSDDAVGGAKSLRRVVVDRTMFGDAMLAFPDVIEQIMSRDPKPTRFFMGDERPTVHTIRHNQPGVLNTPEQVQALEVVTNEPYTMNVPFNQFLDTLEDKNAALELFAEGDLTNRRLNKHDRESREGRNLGVVNALQEIKELNLYYGDRSKEDTPVFYNWNFTSVARMMMLGSSNPQSNKIMRALMLPTWSTMDMTTADAQAAWSLALGQGLGIKIHTMQQADSKAALEKLLEGKLAPAVKSLVAWDAARRKGDTSKKITAAQAKKLRKILEDAGVSDPAWGMFALVEHARLVNATPEERAAFRTPLYLEADGVTNGPIMGMGMLMTSASSINEDKVAALLKGGIALGQQGVTLADMREQDSTDLYGQAGETAPQHISQMLSDVSPEFTQHTMRLIKFMESMFGSKSISIMRDGDGKAVMSINRKLTKNPLTITLYGSGAAGIAGNFVDELREVFHSRMSAAAESLPDNPTDKQWMDALMGSMTAEEQGWFNSLTQNYVYRDKKGNLRTVKNEDGSKFPGAKGPASKRDRDSGYSVEDMTFSSVEYRNLQSALEHLFVGPLRNSITDTVGQDVEDGMSAIQVVTSIQSEIAKATFLKELDTLMAAKKEADPEWRPVDFLTQKEVDELFVRLDEAFPPIQVGGHTFNFMGKAKTFIKNQSVSASLLGGRKMLARMFGPESLGVGGIPGMIIGSGDASMILSSYLTGNMDRTMSVYDGVHLALDKIKAQSELLNDHAYKAMMNNPIRAVLDSFKVTLEKTDLSELVGTDYKVFPPLLKQIFRTLEVPRNEQLDLLHAGPESWKAEINYAVQSFEVMAEMIEANHKAVSAVGGSVDQMASGFAPKQIQSEDVDALPDQSPAAVADEIRGRALTNMLSSSNEEVVNTAKVYSASARATNGLPALAPTAVGERLPSGATRMSMEHLLERSRASDMSSVQREVLREAIRSGALRGWEVITGSPEELAAYSAAAAEALSSEAGSVVHGATLLESKTILLPATGNETLVHEVVHAATVQTVLDVLEGRKASAHAKSAVRNLESLLKQFTSLPVNKLPASAVLAYNDAVATVRKHQAVGTTVGKASAINEMMAWVLGNPSLANAMRQQTVSEKVLAFTTKLFDAVRRMFWGATPVKKPTEDFLSNLHFNTRVLMNVSGQTSRKDRGGSVALHHATVTKPGLKELTSALGARLDTFLSSNVDPLKPYDEVKVALDGLKAVQRKLDRLAWSGFYLNPQEREAAEMVMMAMATGTELDPSVMASAQQMYSHAIKHITPDSFTKVGMDPNLSAEMFDSLTGKQEQGRDALDRSLLLPSFFALAMTSDTMRSVLSGIPMPKAQSARASSFEQAVENAGMKAMDWLDRAYTGRTGKEANLREAMDAAGTKLLVSALEKDGLFTKSSQRYQSLVDKGNDHLVSLMQGADKKMSAAVEALRQNPNSKVAKATADALTLLRVPLSNEGSAAAATAALSFVNAKGVSEWTRNLVSDLIGRTDANGNLYDMIKVVRTKVQQMRQLYREEVPSEIHKKFKTAPTEKQYAAMHRVLGKTDAAALIAGGYTVEQVTRFAQDPKALAKELNVLAKDLRPSLRKADQLANFMVTGVPGVGLMRNAFAVARHTGLDDALTEKLDQYISLKALSLTSEADRTSLQNILEKDADAIGFMLGFAKTLKEEDAKLFEQHPAAKWNNYKGFTPTQFKPGQRLVVRPDNEAADLAVRGYIRVGAYHGSSAEGIKTSRSYFFSPVDGQAVFNQGLIQNTRMTAGGVSREHGYTDSHLIAGRITDADKVAAITARIRHVGDSGTEVLMPVFDDNGEVVAYERSLSQEMLARVEEEAHLAKALGQWRGRQVEEAAAAAVNQGLAAELKRVYTKADAATKRHEFVDLRSAEIQKDPVFRDALALMTPEMMELLEEQFGEKAPIWVERAMLRDVVGYRAASVGDVWTGSTRLPKATQDALRDTLIGVFGMDAYRKAVKSERFVQGVVTDARVLIAVKSLVVPMVNMISNLVHLTTRGVPLHEITKMPRKLVEVQKYVESRAEMVRLETALTAATSGSLEHRRLTNQLQAIEDGHRRLSIWPLIEAGEFSTIAEVGTTHEDMMLARGRLSDYIEAQIDKLPGPVATVGHNLLLSKHTALFRGLQKSVQYGDFLAKAVLYDHLTKTKGMPAKSALAILTDEFVNYDRLPGRTRGYLESIGLLWFYNFKLRSVKVAASTIRNNPLHTLVGMFMPVPDMFGNVGLPVEDNALSKLVDGSLGYSIGPGQGFGAIGLNPWWNLVN